MGRGAAQWAKLSALASLAAFGALFPLYVTIVVVFGVVWADGIEDPTVLHDLLAFGLAAPFMAVPGFVVGRAVGARGRRLAGIVLCSLGTASGVWLVTVSSPVTIWAGMVVGTLFGVVWLTAGEPASATSPSATSPSATSPSAGEPGSAGSREGATGGEVGKATALLDPPLRRLVPRDVLAPPEGWDVPQALPPRPVRCDLDDLPEAASRSAAGRRSEASA